MSEDERTMRYVLDKEGTGFVARCLDPGVTSEGDTEEEAVDNLREALELYFDGDKDFDMLPVAEAGAGDSPWRGRLRQHSQGDRQASALQEQVGGLLDGEVHAASAAEIAEWLGRRPVRWLLTVGSQAGQRGAPDGRRSRRQPPKLADRLADAFNIGEDAAYARVRAGGGPRRGQVAGTMNSKLY